MLIVLRAWLVLLRVRCTLWLRPWAAAERSFARLSVPSLGRRVPTPEFRTPNPDTARLRGAVLAAGHFIPGATCLVQAIALQILLARKGQPSALRLGVSFDAAHAFAAHAWLEQDGCILIGAPDARWTPLLQAQSPAIEFESVDSQEVSDHP